MENLSRTGERERERHEPLRSSRASLQVHQQRKWSTQLPIVLPSVRPLGKDREIRQTNAICYFRIDAKQAADAPEPFLNRISTTANINRVSSQLAGHMYWPTKHHARASYSASEPYMYIGEHPAECSLQVLKETTAPEMRNTGDRSEPTYVHFTCYRRCLKSTHHKYLNWKQHLRRPP